MEERIGNLAGAFAPLAIVISCLGLFGMASFMAKQPVKEIGIRKVLGASVLSLWHLMSKEFILLIVIAFLIAAPLAYLFMHNWLQHYVYHTRRLLVDICVNRRRGLVNHLADRQLSKHQGRAAEPC